MSVRLGGGAKDFVGNSEVQEMVRKTWITIIPCRPDRQSLVILRTRLINNHLLIPSRSAQVDTISDVIMQVHFSIIPVFAYSVIGVAVGQGILPGQRVVPSAYQCQVDTGYINRLTIRGK